MFTTAGSTFKVKRQTILAKLKENLAEYNAEYQEAMIQYRNHLLSTLQRSTAEVDSTDISNFEEMDRQIRKVSLVLPQPPHNYESQYLEAIEMLTYASSEDIEIDRDTFRAWVMNDWKWTGQFKAMVSGYMGA